MSENCALPQPISVRGGSNGIEAHYDSIAGMARLLGDAATHLADTSLQAVAVLGSPSLVATSVLDPGGAALFESALLTTVNLPGGLLWQAGRCGALDVSVRGAALAYMEADRFGSQVLPAVKGVLKAPGAIDDAAFRIASGDFWGGLQQIVVDDPQLADTLLQLSTKGWADPRPHLLIAAFPDGRPKVIATGVDTSAIDIAAPHNLVDVISGLSRRSESDNGGHIDVRFVYTVEPDGTTQRRVIVDIPGTKTWNPLHVGDTTSPGSNLRAIDGDSTTYEDGVIEAMRMAGVTKADQVMLVGHSQGGMIAINAARDVTHSGEFDVTNVVTAGSPIARLPVPKSVQVLAIENASDLIPQVDGADNQDRTNVTTVTVNHSHDGDILANHDIDKSYLPGAKDIQASDDPSVRSVLASMQPFLNGTSVETKTFTVHRVMDNPLDPSANKESVLMPMPRR